MDAAALKVQGGNAGISPGGFHSNKPLPTGVGRFIRVVLEILKYNIAGDGAACCAEIASGPEMSSPVSFADAGEFHLDFQRRASLHLLHEVADGHMWRHGDEQVNVIRYKTPLTISTPISRHACRQISRTRSRNLPCKTLWRYLVIQTM
jgi:hypothetical protein